MNNELTEAELKKIYMFAAELKTAFSLHTWDEAYIKSQLIKKGIGIDLSTLLMDMGFYPYQRYAPKVREIYKKIWGTSIKDNMSMDELKQLKNLLRKYFDTNGDLPDKRVELTVQLISEVIADSE